MALVRSQWIYTEVLDVLAQVWALVHGVFRGSIFAMVSSFLAVISPFLARTGSKLLIKELKECILLNPGCGILMHCTKHTN